MGSISWNRRKQVSSKHEAYYNRNTWQVPFIGEFDGLKVRQALHGKVYNQFNELGAVRQLDETTIEFEILYKIGD